MYIADLLGGWGGGGGGGGGEYDNRGFFESLRA